MDMIYSWSSKCQSLPVLRLAVAWFTYRITMAGSVADSNCYQICLLCLLLLDGSHQSWYLSSSCFLSLRLGPLSSMQVWRHVTCFLSFPTSAPIGDVSWSWTPRYGGPSKLSWVKRSWSEVERGLRVLFGFGWSIPYHRLYHCGNLQEMQGASKHLHQPSGINIQSLNSWLCTLATSPTQCISKGFWALC